MNSGCRSIPLGITPQHTSLIALSHTMPGCRRRSSPLWLKQATVPGARCGAGPAGRRAWAQRCSGDRPASEGPSAARRAWADEGGLRRTLNHSPAASRFLFSSDWRTLGMFGSFTITSIVISVTSTPEAGAGVFLRFLTYNLFNKFILYSRCEIEPEVCPGCIRSTMPSCDTPRELIGVVVAPEKAASNAFKKDCERCCHDPSMSARSQNPASNNRNCTSMASIL